MKPTFVPGFADFSYCLNKWRHRRLQDPAILAEAARAGAKAFQADFMFNHPEGAEENRRRLRDFAAQNGILLTAADYGAPSEERFRRQIATAREMGVTLVRHACGPFLGLQDPMPLKDLTAILRQAARLYEDAGMWFALENHQDYPATQVAAMLADIGSPRVGVLLDTGNSIALLEDPLETAAALAPYTFGVHLKEYAVLPAPLGFDLIGVELGTGVVNNAAILKLLAEKAPVPTLPLLLENPIERCRIAVLGPGFLKHMGHTPFSKAAAIEPLLAKSREIFPEGVTLAFERPGATPDEVCAQEIAHNRAAFAKVPALLP